MSEDEYLASKYHRAVGVRVAMRRRALKMTQEQLSELVGMSRANLSNVEVGSYGTPVPNLYKIAKALKTTIHELIPKDVDEIDMFIMHTAIQELAVKVGLDPVEHEKELREMVGKINRMKERKNDD